MASFLRTQEVLLVIITVLAVKIGQLSAEDQPCQTSDHDVCVCNSSYCDTISRPSNIPENKYHLYTTSNCTPGFSHTTGEFSENTPDSDKHDIVFKINNTIKYQEILGFGGAITDATAILYSSLSKDIQRKLIESYFGEGGIEYSLCRVPIGATDFSERDYTYDDVYDDESLEHFSLAEEDLKYKIPMIKKAVDASTRGLSVFATAWDAPRWMKIRLVEDEPLGYIRKEYYKAWALYHVRFLEAYKENGINVFAISGGNEIYMSLLLAISTNHTCWQPEGHRLWVKEYLIPEMKKANFSHTKFCLLEDQRPFVLDWMACFAADPEAYKMVDFAALHWYFDYYTSTSVLDVFHEKYPDKPILYTESCINSIFRKANKPAVSLGSWRRAELYIYNIIENFNHWTSAYIDWNIALNISGGPTILDPVDAAVIVNTTSGEFYKQPIYYAMGHFSKFMPPGSCRVHVESNQKQPPESASREARSYNMDELANWFNSSFSESQFTRAKIPSVVHSLATTNPDGSHTLFLFNPMNETTCVTVVIDGRWCTDLKLIPHSINTMVY